MAFFDRAATIAAVLSVAAAMFCSTPVRAIGLDRLPLVPTQAAQLADDTPGVDDGSADKSLPDVPLTPNAEYASLADAVAAQDLPDSIDGELACLAGAVFYESHGEPLAGQLAVAEVVLNRAKSGRFPPSACSVVTQRGQFSFVRGGQLPDIAPGRAGYRTAVAVAQVALAKAWSTQAPKALFFHARRVSPSWNREQVASIGNHVFYR